jgi:cellulose synthase/poly-beta-1,6-N-acetylglucosamine synthase-like glycosyltransferase
MNLSFAAVDIASPSVEPTKLPSPPTDTERTIYFGPQHRWVVLSSFVASILVILSILVFFMQRPWALWLTVPVALNLAGACISLVTSSRRRRYSYPQHQKMVEDWSPDYVPSVDVLLPTAGEDLDVLQNTYQHVKALRWHGVLSVVVLDDAARDEVRDLALSHGFRYLVRDNPGHMKKAGNLLHGFRHTSGDFILVLDADFVPRPDLFYDLLPHMDDELNGIVQSPQFFDIDKSRMSWIQHAAGATQVLFYRWVQPSRDRSNAAICVGTSAVYRRQALEAAGGFAQIEHSEDVHTGMRLMKAGYRVRYIPIVVSKGLCPDKFDQFVTQQYRWCSGSMSLLFSKGFHDAKLTFMQRLSYWSGFLYFIGTGVNIFAVVMPPVLMAVFAPSAVNPMNYALVVLALALRQGIIPVITMDKASLTSIMRIQMTYSFSHSLALFDVLRRKTDGWVTTGTRSARSRTATRVGRLSARWCVGVQLVLWALLAVRFGQGYAANFWPLALLTLFNLYLILPIVLRRDVRGVS